MTGSDPSPWQRPPPELTPCHSEVGTRPSREYKPFASNSQTAESGRSPWARPETNTGTENANAAQVSTGEINCLVQTCVSGDAVPKRQSVLDGRSILLLAILPPFALGMLNQFYLESAYRHSKALFYVADSFQFVVVPMLVWFLVLRPAKIQLKDVGLRLPIFGAKPFETGGLFLFVAIVLWIAYEPVNAIAYRYLWREAGIFGYGTVIPKSFPSNAVVVVYFSLTAAFVEEIVFRGLTWSYFSSALPAAWRVPAYIIVTSVLFAAIHSEQGPHGMIAAFSFGLAAAALFVKLKNLWPLVFGHFVGDVIAFWPT